jgi:hypothetical protein
VFATSINFHPSLIFADKAEAYQNVVSYNTHSNGKLNSLVRKYYTRVEVNGSGKHSSLLQYGNNYCQKKFNSTGPWLKKFNLIQEIMDKL